MFTTGAPVAVSGSGIYLLPAATVALLGGFSLWGVVLAGVVVALLVACYDLVLKARRQRHRSAMLRRLLTPDRMDELRRIHVDLLGALASGDIAAATDLESDFADGTLTYAVRLIMSPFAHALYTGLAAWGLGALLCRTDRSLSWRLQRVAGWFLLAVCVHGAFNASSELPGAAGLIAMLVTVAASWCLLVWCYRRSRAVGADAATESHTSR